jgi:hypothetical protein
MTLFLCIAFGALCIEQYFNLLYSCQDVWEKTGASLANVAARFRVCVTDERLLLNSPKLLQSEQYFVILKQPLDTVPFKA